MSFDDLITLRPPPPDRIGKVEGEHEHHFYEGAVMVAYAMHLLTSEDADEVRIHPDGEHGKQFDFAGWFARRGFAKVSEAGQTAYGGTYADSEGRTVVILPKSGLGDVVAKVGGTTIMAECKGGILNTRHPGQKSRLSKGLCEMVGRLMASQSPGRQIAVAPFTTETCRLAQRLAPRCKLAGIELALVKGDGRVLAVNPDSTEQI